MARPVRPQRQAAAAAAGRIRGLSDLGGEDDESEEDDSNEYYAGGEKSGQVASLTQTVRLLGAHKKSTGQVRVLPIMQVVRGGDGRRGRDVESIFERARQAGATLGTAADLEAAPAARGGAFKGRARTLGVLTFPTVDTCTAKGTAMQTRV